MIGSENYYVVVLLVILLLKEVWFSRGKISYGVLFRNELISNQPVSTVVLLYSSSFMQTFVTEKL